MAHPRVTWLDGEEDQPEMRLLAALSADRRPVAVPNAANRGDGGGAFWAGARGSFSCGDAGEARSDAAAEALPAIHAPEDAEELARARRRFVFQELFVLQLAVVARRWQQRTGFRAPPLVATADIDARIRRRFPFELTAGQQAAIREVADDMAHETPMNRLLQGDVGSGKTVVAVYAMLVCVAHGYQAALMAPTEILARQHADTLAELLRASRVRYLLLTGGLTAKEREQALAEIAAGKIDLVIGTHAVVQEDVRFAKLGLVVIDEQHKFGVRQRAALRQGQQSPHYLVMTATPIPRTISMTLFGDLDVTTLREMPPGRQPVSTYLVTPEERRGGGISSRKSCEPGGRRSWWRRWWRNRKISRRPACRRRSSGSRTASWRRFAWASFTAGCRPAEKEQAMADFRAGRTQVLVSTSVIEVGVDVPNACVMAIDSAERFGLAQLHQLRGRVGRGALAGFCGVLVRGELDEEARARLEAFASTTDGFELAELDFQLRGPGDLFGTQQHGLPPLRIADLRRDQEVVAEAQARPSNYLRPTRGCMPPIIIVCVDRCSRATVARSS